MSKGIEYLNGPEKRALDLSVSFFSIIPSLGVAGVTAAVLSREVGGFQNSLFMQPRAVRGGKRVTIPKLRTINPKHTEGKPLVNMGVMDPRAGKIGRFVRQIGLDETLQMWSVLRGHMSLVGPRPRPDFELDAYRAADPELYDEWRDFLTSVKPGLFGLSQVLRHSHPHAVGDEIMIDSMRLELEYGRQASLATDLGIMIGTAPGLVKAAQSSYQEANAQSTVRGA